MKLKICGMKDSQNILEVSTLLPEYMGFIFWKKSSRFFEGELPELPESIQKVGVFVDASIEEIISKIEKYQLQGVQLHGKESPEFCKLLQSFPINIIKVFAIEDTFNFDTLQPYEPVSDYFLLDAKGKLPGGNGVAFNWEILKKYPSEKPFFLSGGIGIESLENLKKLKLPIHAIDVNSKFEIQPGYKNIQNLKIFQTHLNEIS